MRGLGPADFAEFYQEVNAGRDPFPWQSDIVTRVLESGTWPSAVDVPTGLGKTSMIDVAVFVAAASVDQSPTERPGRRRVFFVVDRRLVVDEAHTHAAALSRRLEEAERGQDTSVLGEVARALRRYAPEAHLRLDAAPDAGPSAVLSVTRMRGGVTWDRDWLSRPDLPGVVIGTVDQVGSRLFFRGYGLSDYRLPIDAALVGTDSLFLVDEAHLATAMASTLRAAQQRDTSVLPVARPTMVLLSATQDPGNDAYPFDVSQHEGHPVAWPRLTAQKSLRLVETDGKGVVREMARRALELQAERSTVLVVCNTVDRARQVHTEIGRACRRERGHDAVAVDLLIGRSRPADRAVLVDQVLARFGAGRAVDDQDRGSILVATQTVEVGVNLDADALVTESAPWDSLVQRLGRLNRLGARNPASAVVVHDGVEDGPVYGEARHRCWQVLQRLAADREDGEIAVSPLECRELAQRFVEAGAVAQPPPAPWVTASVLDRWASTSPRPHPDVDVAPYLHGLGRISPSVVVAWRAGLRTADQEGGRLPSDEATLFLNAVPVTTAEQIELPVHAVRRWLRGEQVGTVSDLEGEVDPEPKARQSREPFEVLVWRDELLRDGRRAGRWTWTGADGIRPGDQLVVPVEEGGLDRYGWAPTSSDLVQDVSEAVRFGAADDSRRGAVAQRRVLRLDPALGIRLGMDVDEASELARVVESVLDGGPDGDMAPLLLRLRNHLVSLLATTAGADERGRVGGSAWEEGQLRDLLAWLEREPRVQHLGEPVNDDVDIHFAGPRPVALLVDASSRDGMLVREDESAGGSSAASEPVGLAQHHRNVGDRARGIAEALGLEPDLLRSVEVAARLHDHGKQERRFQAMLVGGDEVVALIQPEPLAKSGLDPSDRRAFQLAHRRSRLPSGARHEVWSAAVAAELLEGRTDVDHELVRHLVVSHHGRGRPSLMPLVDPEPTEIVVKDADRQVELSSAVPFDHDQADRFWALTERYGRWGLALLETVVRCADMTVSGEGS